MKKQIAAFLIAFLTISISVNAQCTPDTTIKDPGYYPDTFDPAVVGEKFAQELQLRVLPDTVINYNGFPVKAIIDSIKLLEIIGLPSSFSYECYNDSCVYIPSETGCAVLNGMPTMADVGTHNLDLVVRVHAHVATMILEQDDTLSDQFALVVNRTGNISLVPKNVKPGFYPNPSNSGLFEINNLDWMNSKVELFDLMGKLVSKTEMNGNTLDISDLPEGMYSYILTNKNGSTSVGRLMSVRH